MEYDNDHPIYYRLMVHSMGHRAVIVTMQDFDESHYDESRYITNRKFDSEEEAMNFCKRYEHSSRIPAHVRTLIQALLEQDVNVDPYLTEEEEW